MCKKMGTRQQLNCNNQNCISNSSRMESDINPYTSVENRTSTGMDDENRTVDHYNITRTYLRPANMADLILHSK
jgi:hypothetical protein